MPRTRHLSVIVVIALAAAGAAVVAPVDVAPTAAASDACIASQRYNPVLTDAGAVTVSRMDGTVAGLLPYARAIDPDGSRIAYLEWFEGKSANPRLMVSAPDGSNARVLYDFSANPAVDFEGYMIWSPTGDHIAFVTDSNSISETERLMVIDVDSATVTLTSPFRVIWDGFDFSPDGQKIVYVDASDIFDGADIWTANSNGTGSPTRIVDHTASDFALPPYNSPKSVSDVRWSPDGTRIAFSGRNAVNSATQTAAYHELYVMNANGSGLHEVAIPAGVDQTRFAPAWSPDSTRLAYSFSTTSTVNSQLVTTSGISIVTLSNDAKNLIPGTEGLNVEFQHGRAEWANDSATIVFYGTRMTGTPGSLKFEYGTYAVPVAGGPVNVYPTEKQINLETPFIGLVPCDVVPPSAFNGLTPDRLMDSREGIGVPQAPLGQQSAVDLTVLGRGGVPTSGVEAVVLNVTVTNNNDSSFLTVYPTGVARPNASNLNWTAGTTVPNAVVVKVGAEGKVSFFNNSGSTDVIADVVGWFESGPGFVGITPNRILDTRTGIGSPAEPLIGGQPRSLQVHGPVVPATATGVIMNTTATDGTADGFVTVYPAGLSLPLASSLNVKPGQTAPNLIVSGIGSGGQINLFTNAGTVHAIGDVSGYFEAGSGFHGIVPTRVFDTRSSGGRIAPGSSKDVKVRGGTTNVPANASAVVVNVTVTAPTESSFLTVYPAGVARPTASSLNYVAGQTVPNLVFASIGTDNEITLYNNTGQVHAIVDIVGWFA